MSRDEAIKMAEGAGFMGLFATRVADLLQSIAPDPPAISLQEELERIIRGVIVVADDFQDEATTEAVSKIVTIIEREKQKFGCIY